MICLAIFIQAFFLRPNPSLAPPPFLISSSFSSSSSHRPPPRPTPGLFFSSFFFPHVRRRPPGLSRGLVQANEERILQAQGGTLAEGVPPFPLSRPKARSINGSRTPLGESGGVGGSAISLGQEEYMNTPILISSQRVCVKL